MTNIIDELKKMVDETEFSDRVRDKVKELAVKAKLRKESGAKDEDCLSAEEKDNLLNLIQADMVLDAMKIKTYEAYLGQMDRIVSGFKK